MKKPIIKDITNIVINITFSDGTKNVIENPKDIILYCGKFKTKKGLLRGIDDNYEVIMGKGINVLTMLGGILKQIIDMTNLRMVMKVIAFAVTKSQKGQLTILDPNNMGESLNVNKKKLPEAEA